MSHEPVQEWTELSRSEVERRVSQGRWIVYFYSRAYCATDCAAVAKLARSRSDLGVAELCPERQHSWSGEVGTLPLVRVYQDGQLLASRTGPGLTLTCLEELLVAAEESSF